MIKFIKHSLSIDEAKVSSLIIGYLVLLGCVVIGVVKHGDIGSNVLTLMNTFIISIAGVNVANNFTPNKKVEDVDSELR